MDPQYTHCVLKWSSAESSINCSDTVCAVCCGLLSGGRVQAPRPRPQISTFYHESRVLAQVRILGIEHYTPLNEVEFAWFENVRSVVLCQDASTLSMCAVLRPQRVRVPEYLRSRSKAELRILSSWSVQQLRSELCTKARLNCSMYA